MEHSGVICERVILSVVVNCDPKVLREVQVIFAAWLRYVSEQSKLKCESEVSMITYVTL
jgi:hypothetical protein